MFSPFRTKLENTSNNRAIQVGRDTVHTDVEKLCEFLQNVYKEAVIYRNFVSKFCACGVWSEATKDADTSVIQWKNLTNCDCYSNREQADNNFKELIVAYQSSQALLRSDSEIVSSGHMHTSSGASHVAFNPICFIWASERKVCCKWCSKSVRERGRDELTSAQGWGKDSSGGEASFFDEGKSTQRMAQTKIKAMRKVQW